MDDKLDRFIEGYIKEIADATSAAPKVIIDPATPFAIEYDNKRYALLMSRKKSGDGKCDVVDAALLILTICGLELSGKGCRPQILATIKTSHAKCRFHLDELAHEIKSLDII